MDPCPRRWADVQRSGSVRSACRRSLSRTASPLLRRQRGPLLSPLAHVNVNTVVALPCPGCPLAHLRRHSSPSRHSLLDVLLPTGSDVHAHVGTYVPEGRHVYGLRVAVRLARSRAPECLKCERSSEGSVIVSLLFWRGRKVGISWA